MMRSFTNTILFLATALALLAAVPARSAPDCSVSLTPSLAPQDFPDDAGCRPEAVPFGHLAWQTFKMLVWPASTSVGGASVRGKADTARSLSDLAGPRVFETYKSDWETFPPQAGTPLDWNIYAPTATVCSNAPAIAPGTLVLGSLNKFGNIREGGVDGV